MDKNTLWGMLLMGAIIFGFMYLQKPSEEELAKQRQQAEQLAAEEQQKATDADNVLSIDSVSPAEIETLRNTIKQFGATDTVNGTTLYKLNTGDLNLTLNPADNVVGGTVKTTSGDVPVTSILSGKYGNIKPATAKAAVGNLKKGLVDIAKYQGFSKYLSGDSTVVTLKNDVIELAIANKGGVIAEAKLLDPKYTSYDSTQVKLLSPGYGDYSFTLTTQNQRFDTREFYFTPVEVSDTSVTMALDLGDGAMWALHYTLAPGENYTVKMAVEQKGMQQIIPANVSSMDFSWSQKMPRNEAGRVFEQRNSALYYKYSSGSVEHLSESGSDDEEINERLRWIGFKNQFFSAVLIADENFTSAALKSKALDNNDDFIKELETSATLDYNATLANPASFTFYLGPNLYPLLSDLSDKIVPEQDMQFTKMIPLGWSLFRWINTLIIIPVFTFLGSFITNYGLIILLLTIFIKLIIFPFTYKSYLSQARMRLLAPEISEINEKYPGQENAMKRQQQTMALYSKAGASPFSGCLPMLLQLPILVAMFNFFPSAIELRGQSFLWAKDLSAPDAIVSWTTNIPFISSTFGNHISLFCLLMTVTNIAYSYYNMQSQPQNNAMPGMKWMMLLMPLMFLVFFNNYASGLSLYYFLFLLFTIVQMWVFRKVVNEDKLRAQMAASAKKTKKKSGFMARLEEAQKRQQQMLREQQKQNAKRR